MVIVLKKSELINIIQSLSGFEVPKLEFEQYITDAVATADLIYHIAFEQNDLQQNLIVDLGCGPGNLTIAALLCDATHVIAIDIDSDVLEVLNHNLDNLELKNNVTVLNSDIRTDDFSQKIQIIIEEYKKSHPECLRIITISNPPFGVHQKGIDWQFIQQAMKFSDVIYSIHLGNPKSREYLEKKIEQNGGKITFKAQLALMLKASYVDHKQHIKPIQTDVFRIEIKRKKKE